MSNCITDSLEVKHPFTRYFEGEITFEEAINEAYPLLEEKINEEILLAFQNEKYIEPISKDLYTILEERLNSDEFLTKINNGE